MLATILIAACTALLTTAGVLFLLRTRMQPALPPEYRPEITARHILRHPIWQWRSFRILRHHLGGYGDDDLRRILVQAGAVRFETEAGEEVWGLYERVGHLLEGDRYPTLAKAFSAIDSVELSPEMQREIRILVAEGRKSVATNRVRETTGLSLTQSATLVERL